MTVCICKSITKEVGLSDSEWTTLSTGQCFFSFRFYFSFSFSFSFDSNFVLVLLAFHFNVWQSLGLIVLTAL